MLNTTPAKIDAAQARAALPDDVEALKALVLEQRLALATRDTEIEQLKLLIPKLKRMQFGRSSDRLSALGHNSIGGGVNFQSAATLT